MKSKKNKIIVFANQKGGVGKSTLCILLADYLTYWKKDVCIIAQDDADADGECTISGWLCAV